MRSASHPRTRLLQFIALAGNLSIHGIRCEINLTGPRDGAIINEDLLEELLIAQRRECTSQSLRPQPDTPRYSVFESNKEAVVRLWFHFNYVPIHRTDTPFMPAAQFSSALCSRRRTASLSTIPLYVSSPFLEQTDCRHSRC
ncbi:hypothetical protein SBA4_2120028 [Candidatus Sulfopaludibacter sp. SbA4]|nr:hypothetical protein SBA4_2120028 [Candidatus Sulfopaludibacter sp. SbA4]